MKNKKVIFENILVKNIFSLFLAQKMNHMSSYVSTSSSLKLKYMPLIMM